MIKSRRYISPVVIKRVTHVEVRGNRAEWKVAYADLVTAMMAFFLLLWLLSVATPDQKEAIADYFKPSMGIGGASGVGLLGGKYSGEEGATDDSLKPVGLVSGQVKQGDAPENWVSETGESLSDAQFAANIKKPTDFMDPTGEFRSLTEGINQAISVDPTLKNRKQEIFMQDTPQGLKIELIDSHRHPFFMADTTELTPQGMQTLQKIARVIAASTNAIGIEGHVESNTRTVMSDQYTDWELSVDRANAVRRTLMDTHIDPARIEKVVGMADMDPLVPQKPSSMRNRRITIVLTHNYGALPLAKSVAPKAKAPEPVFKETRKPSLTK